MGGSGEVELVTQSRREDKIIHVCSYRAEHRGGKKCFRTQSIILFLLLEEVLRFHAGTFEGEVPGVRHLTIAPTEVLP